MANTSGKIKPLGLFLCIFGILLNSFSAFVCIYIPFAHVPTYKHWHEVFCYICAAFYSIQTLYYLLALLVPSCLFGGRWARFKLLPAWIIQLLGPPAGLFVYAHILAMQESGAVKEESKVIFYYLTISWAIARVLGWFFNLIMFIVFAFVGRTSSTVRTGLYQLVRIGTEIYP